MNESDDTDNAATITNVEHEAVSARSRIPAPRTAGHSNQHGEHRQHSERRASSNSSLCRRIGSAEQPRTSSSTSATTYQQQHTAQRMWGVQEYSWPGGPLYPMPVASYNSSYPHALPVYPRYFLTAQYPHVPPDCSYTSGMAYGYPMLHMQPDAGGQQVQPFAPPAHVRQGAGGHVVDRHRVHQRGPLDAPSLEGAAQPPDQPPATAPTGAALHAASLRPPPSPQYTRRPTLRPSTPGSKQHSLAPPRPPPHAAPQLADSARRGSSKLPALPQPQLRLQAAAPAAADPQLPPGPPTAPSLSSRRGPVFAPHHPRHQHQHQHQPPLQQPQQRRSGGHSSASGGLGRGGEAREMGQEQAEAAMVEVLRGVQLVSEPQGAGQVARRPGLGASGRRVEVFVNHFLVGLGAVEVLHYDVTITLLRAQGSQDEDALVTAGWRGDSSVGTKWARRVVALAAQVHGWGAGFVFDGRKNLFSPGQALPLGETTAHVQLPGTSRELLFKVTTKWVATLDMAPLAQLCAQHGSKGGGRAASREAIQALDVALRHGAAMHPSCVAVGRCLFFYDPATVTALGGGCEAWLGYQQALRPCQMGLALTVDSAATAFLEAQPAHLLMLPLLRCTPPQPLTRAPNPSQMRDLRRTFEDVKVKVTHLPKAQRTYKVIGLTDTPAAATMFHNQTLGCMVSVADHFRSAYAPLQYPLLPCLLVAGFGGRPISYPPEVCHILRGQRKLRLSDIQTANMIKVAAQDPLTRKRHIDQAVNQQASLPSDPSAAAFGLSVSPDMVRCEARVLRQPVLAYRAPLCLDVGPAGQWNLINARFWSGSTLSSFGVVSFASWEEVGGDGPTSLPSFVQALLQMLRSMGMQVDGRLPPVVQGGPCLQQPQLALQEAATLAASFFRCKPQLLLVLLPNKGAELYCRVKQAGDRAMGIPTQCFVMKAAGVGRGARADRRAQYCASLALKINAKLGGTNVRLAGAPEKVLPVIGSRPFMLLGADVTHPTSRSEAEPSVAAVVASLDRYAGRYSSRVVQQPNRCEIIRELQPLVQQLLLDFYRFNHQRKPEAIVFFRDGVSDGQFAEVLASEYTAIRAACGSMGDPDYTPPITFIIVQKRHNTRMFPTDNNCDRSGNVLPGTVIDTGVVHCSEWDFYLNSHSGIHGTSKAAHYNVLVDEIGFGADGLQLLTYWLCYLYCRCTRSVSYAPPAYYAHLAAFRGKIMLSSSPSSQPASSAATTGSSSSSPSPPACDVDGITHTPTIHPDLETTMFYV